MRIIAKAISPRGYDILIEGAQSFDPETGLVVFDNGMGTQYFPTEVFTLTDADEIEEENK